MGSAQEIEFKIRFEGQEAARRFVDVARSRAGTSGEVARQVNHFFDTRSGVLRGERLAVRLREAGGRAVLTLKGAGVEATDHAPSARPEEEVVVPEDLARLVLAGERGVLDVARELWPDANPLLTAVERVASDQELVHVGSFANERLCIGPLACGAVQATLEVDRTEFPAGRVDHEVELEVPESAVGDARALLEELLREAGLPWLPSTGKASRFFAILGG